VRPGVRGLQWHGLIYFSHSADLLQLAGAQ
jgi:hypothetical protein